MKRGAVYVLASFAVLMMFAPAANAFCPTVKATNWRGEISNKSIRATVSKKFAGDWSTYIAHWERQKDTAVDIHARQRVLVVRIGKKRINLGGDNLQTYIAGMRNRIVVAYCLKLTDDEQAKKSTAERQHFKGNIAAGKKLAQLATCTKCHGPDAKPDKNFTPRLAGQNAQYLSNQIRAFSARHQISTGIYGLSLRDNKAIAEIVSNLTRRETTDIAVYFQDQRCQPGSSIAPAVAAPANAEFCSVCHGADGISASPEIPNIAGQNPVYLNRQLRNFRLTQGNPKAFNFRSRRHHQFMSAIAGTLTNEEMRKLAAYYGSMSCRAD